jgi:putative ABC transport system permease protein
MAMFLSELANAVRTLQRHPAFFVTAAGTLAIGICANVTVFSMVNGVLLRPMPFGERTDRVVALHSTHHLQAEDLDNSGVSSADLLDVRRETRSFEHVGGYSVRNFTVASGNGAERLMGVSVTPDLFPMLGIEPALGRTFTSADAAAPSGFETAVILTHGVWQSHYGGDPNIIGRAVIINDRAWTVVGVMPPGFRFPQRAQLYAPLFLDAESARTIRTVSGIALMKPAITRQQAQAEVDGVAARLESAFPTTNRGYGIRVVTFRDSQVAPQSRIAMSALMTAVVFVLLIACANLANLLFVRGTARQRDMAIRAAMGASRSRLMGHVLAESAIVTAAGTAVGVSGALWCIRVIPSAWPEEFPYWLRLDPDVRMVAFTIGLTVFTTLAVGLLPAVRVSRPRVTGPLSHGGRAASLGRSSHRVQQGLAIGQVALCLALLVGAHLMIRSFLSLQRADLGFDERPLLSLRVFATGDAFDPIPARAALFARALDAVKALPGVTAAAATSAVPGDDGGAVIRVTKDGAAEQFVGAHAITMTPGLFDTLAVRIEQGRTFTANEFANPESDAVVINESLAKRLWPGQSALNRRVGLATADPRTDGVSWRRVVGVAPDLVYEEPGEQTEQSRLNVFLPYARSPQRTMAFLIRGDGNPAALIEPARRAFGQVHGGLAVFDVSTMSERRRMTNGEQRAFGTMMGGFATAALLLACLGIYGLLADSARQRTQEIGVRLAIGATPRLILVLFVRQAAIIGAAGVVIGTVLAVLVAQALSGVLFGIDPLAVMPIVLTAAALIAAVLIAAYVPARRASKVEPLVALRIE